MINGVNVLSRIFISGLPRFKILRALRISQLMMKLNASGSTNTLSSQPDMDAVICQDITTELTIHGNKVGFYFHMLSHGINIIIWFYPMPNCLIVLALNRQDNVKKQINLIAITITHMVIIVIIATGHNPNQKPCVAYTGL